MNGSGTKEQTISRRIRIGDSAGVKEFPLRSLQSADVVVGVNPRKSAERRIQKDIDEQSIVRPAQSMEQALLESIRNGTWSTSITAERLEQVVRESSAAGHEDGYRDGYAEGMERGHAAGREAGLKAAQAEIDGQLSRLRDLMGNLLEPIEAQREALVTALTQLIVAAAKEVVLRELRTDSSVVRAILNQAISAMPTGARNLRVYVSNPDYELLSREGVDLLAADARLFADPTLGLGDCRILSEDSLLDWSVDGRLKQLVKELFNGDG